MWIIAIILVYFAVLMAISRLAAKRTTNETFFRANRRSPWYMVAFGMVGASISGVTFVSVPGMVLSSQMTYLQVCLGFIVGYLAVAFVLLPVYYKLNLTSIYTYLGLRLGSHSYETGAWFFLLSKMIGAAVTFYKDDIETKRGYLTLGIHTMFGIGGKKFLDYFREFNKEDDSNNGSNSGSNSATESETKDATYNVYITPFAEIPLSRSASLEAMAQIGVCDISGDMSLNFKITASARKTF